MTDAPKVMLQEQWRERSDVEIATAFANLSDYTPEAQAAISAEFHRRRPASVNSRSTDTGSAIQEGIDQLEAFLGAREPVAANFLRRVHAAGQLEELVVAIAKEMRLPAGFQLSIVSKDTRFRSRHLARTDRSGHGIEGIEAQVLIPSDLPLFGSQDLKRCRIAVLITPAFRTARPDTAITILAHELSHVLLHSLRHPERETEVFTDLVPIVLGFVEIVQRGRRVTISETTRDGATHTTTTTYGYLSDADFSIAVGRVDSLLASRQAVERGVVEAIASLRAVARRGSTLLEDFRLLKDHLDTTKRQVRPTDAMRVVAIHAPDYTAEIEAAMRSAVDVTERAWSFVEAVTEYPKDTLAALQEHKRVCASAVSRLDRALLEISADVAVLKRSAGMHYRFRTVLARIARACRRCPGLRTRDG